MKSDMDMVVVHDGEKWIAKNEAITVSGKSFPELDANLAAALRQEGHRQGSRLTVFMGFDMTTIPSWIHQYAPHYFNRYVHVEV